MTTTQHSSGRSRGARLLLILVAVVLIPFGGAFLSVKSLFLNELIVPLLFLVTLLDFSMRTKDFNRFKGIGDNLLGVFVTLFLFVVLLNYFRNPVLPSSLVEGGEGGIGFKNYYHFACGYLVFLTILYWTSGGNVSARYVLRIVAGVALIACIAGILIRFAGLNIPGLESLTWSAAEVKGWDENGGSVRVGVLDQFGQLGLLLTLSGVAFNRRRLWILFAMFFGICILLGGGRVALGSTVMAIALLLILKRRYLLGLGMVVAIILGVLFIHTIHGLAPSGQLARLSNFGSLEESSIGRYYIYKFGIRDFLDHPLFGTGYGKLEDLGYIRLQGEYTSAEGIANQLATGGHATYIAILKNMGLAGFIPFMLIWVYILLKLYRPARSRQLQPDDVLRRNAQFIMTMVFAMLVRMLVEGNGSEMQLYMYAGIAGAVINEWLVTRKVHASVSLGRGFPTVAQIGSGTRKH